MGLHARFQPTEGDTVRILRESPNDLYLVTSIVARGKHRWAILNNGAREVAVSNLRLPITRIKREAPTLAQLALEAENAAQAWPTRGNRDRASLAYLRLVQQRPSVHVPRWKGKVADFLGISVEPTMDHGALRKALDFLGE
jgi:hypothetical protein